MSALDRTAPVGKPKPPAPPRDPAIRLTSSAVYHRPEAVNTLGGIELASTYQATVSAVDPADMTRRCLRARVESKRHEMVVAAARSIPIDRVEEIAAMAAADTAAATATKLQTERLAATAREAGVAPLVTPALAELTAKLAEEPRYPSSHRMAREFFSDAASDGPFPGAKSTMGAAAATAFYNITKGAAGGALHMTKPERFAPSGYRLRNYANMG